jgi:hypothetical protein
MKDFNEMLKFLNKLIENKGACDGIICNTCCPLMSYDYCFESFAYTEALKLKEYYTKFNLVFQSQISTN